ncbi:hypothetical protein P0F39_001988 [Vibrio metschnikovii]|nr:hypothetical protein [Vibrio metschnikovii]EKO3887504.1 hypothetical protein [Vibrio metschnikovii]
MSNNFAVILKGNKYFIASPNDDEQSEHNGDKIAIARSFVKNMNADPSIIESIESVEFVQGNNDFTIVELLPNKFILFLKNDLNITIEMATLKPMSKKDQFEFGIEYLKSSGLSPDLLDRIGSEEDLKKQNNTNILLIGLWIAIMLGVFTYIFS